jgi:hypothetical protein|tara:strand:+ start:50 stop:391 length:342 start_codon:yes stop_codon:yes gene_type:complete
MRKIKICVATLLLGGFCYGQNVDAYKKQVFDRQTELFEESVKEFQQLNFLIEDIVDNLRKDMHYGHITINVGNYYLNEIIIVKRKNRELMHQLWLHRNKTIGEHAIELDYDNE